MTSSHRSRAWMALAFVAGVLGTSVAHADPVLRCNFAKASKAPPPSGPVLAAVTKGALTEIPLNSVQFTDKGITRKVLVQGLYARRSEVNSVEVIARVVNCTDHALHIEGRTNFMDAMQLPTEPVSAWQRVFLAPRSVGVYREISVDTQGVANFLVELREAR